MKILILSFFLLLNLESFIAQSSNNKFLVQIKDLIYKGAFLVPNISGNKTLSYGGQAITYNPNNNSLFITGHTYYQLVTEISIPEALVTSNINLLNRAVVLQSGEDITEGNIAKIGLNGNPISNNNYNMLLGGLLISDSLLIGSVYPYYEDATQAQYSHFTSGLKINLLGDFKGMFKIGKQQAGFVSGYMTHITKEWQFTLGGNILTGQACIPIISRSSFGPSISSFNLEELINLSNLGNISSKELINYPENHQTLGRWDNETYSNPVFNMTTGVSGVVMPKLTNSILFFGKTGIGIPKYGTPTNDSTLQLERVNDHEWKNIYDPANMYKGCHAWPYKYYVWAYDATELNNVLNGTKKPWEIIPYDSWELNLPFKDDKTNDCFIGSATYDATTGRIFISQLEADGSRPIIHIFEINYNDLLDTESPSIPQNLKAEIVQEKIKLSWDQSADNFEMDGYEIEKNGNYLTKIYSLNYTDQNPGSNYIEYRVRAKDKAGNYSGYSNQVNVTLSSIENEINSVTSYNLYQNYPNPFNPSTIIKYDISESGNVRIEIYNILGTKIFNLLDEYKLKGRHQVVFDARELPSGLYIYRIISGKYTQSKKLMLVK